MSEVVRKYYENNARHAGVSEFSDEFRDLNHLYKEKEMIDLWHNYTGISFLSIITV